MKTSFQMLCEYAKPHKKKFIIGLLALFGVDLLSSAPPLILKEFIDLAQKSFDTKNISKEHFFLLGSLYIGISLVQSWLRYVWRMHLITASHLAAETIRNQYHAKLQRLPKSFYDRNPIGNLMALATNDIEAVRFAIGPALLVFADAIFLFLTIPPFMYLLSPKLTLISLIPVLTLPFVIPKIESAIHHHFQNVQNHFSKLTGFAQENLEGIQVIKSFVRERNQVERFDMLGREFVVLNLKLTKVQAIVEPLFLSTIAVGFFLLIWVGGGDVNSDLIGIGTFIAFTKYLESLAWPMMALGMALTQYQRGKTSLGRIQSILHEPEEKGDLKASSLSFSTSKPLLEVKNLSFQYPNGGFALQNVSFTIEERSKTALIGPVGSGKSTLVQLLSGILIPPRGTLFLKGIDFADLDLKTLREMISVSHQDPFLFSETLAWNVGLGLDAELNKDKLKKHALIERCLETAAFGIDTRKFGLEYRIGQRGQNLSGGGRARVSLARALAKSNELLILDDTLSNVDAITETKIRNSLIENKNTIFMTTHRFSGLPRFDQILMLSHGKITETGTHTELMNNSSLYKQIFRMQA